VNTGLTPAFRSRFLTESAGPPRLSLQAMARKPVESPDLSLSQRRPGPAPPFPGQNFPPSRPENVMEIAGSGRPEGSCPYILAYILGDEEKVAYHRGPPSSLSGAARKRKQKLPVVTISHGSPYRDWHYDPPPTGAPEINERTKIIYLAKSKQSPTLLTIFHQTNTSSKRTISTGTFP